LAEAESELVAGFLTEYSGLRWSYFFMAEYGSMLLVGGLAAILFFGGWHGPIPVFDLLGWSYAPDATAWSVTGFLANLAGCVNFLAKAILGVTVMMWARWTLPRLRIDQVMTMCLKYCVPIAAFCFVGALTWQVLEIPFLNDLFPPAQGRATVRETWVAEGEPGKAAPQKEASSNSPQASVPTGSPTSEQRLYEFTNRPASERLASERQASERQGSERQGSERQGADG
jgi:NADH-quinone oxidoreductase subunit H